MHKSKLVGLVVALLAAIATTVALAPAASATGPTYGGDSIRDDGYSCTAGIPVRSGSGQSYIITAGHCTVSRPELNWENVSFGPLVIGPSARASFGTRGQDGSARGQDIGAIRSAKNLFPNPQLRGASGTYTIVAMRDPNPTERVCVTGGESRRDYCGTVTTQNTNQLVDGAPDLGVERIYYLAAVTLDAGVSCPIHGDSGGPARTGPASGVTAVGVLSGCDPGRRLMFVAKIGGVISSWDLHL